MRSDEVGIRIISLGDQITMVAEVDMELTSSHKYIKNTSTCGTILIEQLLQAGGRPQTSKRARKSPSNWVKQSKKKRKRKYQKRNQMGLAPQGESCERGNISPPWEEGRSVRTEGEPQRTQQSVCGRQSRETPAQMGTPPPGTPLLAVRIAGGAGGRVLRLRC